MPQPLISIIIPFYNVELYIAVCLESVYNQDISEDFYEVICVNDASLDNSRNIVLEYKMKHRNLTLIEHPVNQKLGAARNTGRSLARGKYIWNVDSDDCIKPNILKHILDICEDNNLDVLIFNFDHLILSTSKLNKAYPFINTNVLSGVDFINKYCQNKFREISPIWTQIYRTEFLDKNEIYSPPINMGEDVPFTLKALLLSERIMSITDSCYVYRFNETSLGGTIEVIPTAERLYEKCFICARHVYDIIKLIPPDESIIKHEITLVCKYILSLYPKYLNKLELDEVYKFKSLCRYDILRNKNLYRIMGKRNKIKYFLFLVSLHNLQIQNA